MPVGNVGFNLTRFVSGVCAGSISGTRSSWTSIVSRIACFSFIHVYLDLSARYSFSQSCDSICQSVAPGSSFAIVVVNLVSTCPIIAESTVAPGSHFVRSDRAFESLDTHELKDPFVATSSGSAKILFSDFQYFVESLSMCGSYERYSMCHSRMGERGNSIKSSWLKMSLFSLGTAPAICAPKLAMSASTAWKFFLKQSSAHGFMSTKRRPAWFASVITCTINSLLPYASSFVWSTRIGMPLFTSWIFGKRLMSQLPPAPLVVRITWFLHILTSDSLITPSALAKVSISFTFPPFQFSSVILNSRLVSRYEDLTT
mmetsp:Transcript_8970/g.21218  ORF Transcript_8970/g.21218 Transcript_8970/m.21218 type:complete len:315 (-) Transcript_8970:2873-3817(-)